MRGFVLGLIFGVGLIIGGLHYLGYWKFENGSLRFASPIETGSCSNCTKSEGNPEKPASTEKNDRFQEINSLDKPIPQPGFSGLVRISHTELIGVYDHKNYGYRDKNDNSFLKLSHFVENPERSQCEPVFYEDDSDKKELRRGLPPIGVCSKEASWLHKIVESDGGFSHVPLELVAPDPMKSDEIVLPSDLESVCNLPVSGSSNPIIITAEASYNRGGGDFGRLFQIELSDTKATIIGIAKLPEKWEMLNIDKPEAGNEKDQNKEEERNIWDVEGIICKWAEDGQDDIEPHKRDVSIVLAERGNIEFKGGQTPNTADRFTKIVRGGAKIEANLVRLEPFSFANGISDETAFETNVFASTSIKGPLPRCATTPGEWRSVGELHYDLETKNLYASSTFEQKSRKDNQLCSTIYQICGDNNCNFDPFEINNDTKLGQSYLNVPFSENRFEGLTGGNGETLLTVSTENEDRDAGKLGYIIP
ncbi:MAG: hypothetical protein AAF668_13685 [Pseudomonadota bacterium]